MMDMNRCSAALCNEENSLIIELIETRNSLRAAGEATENIDICLEAIKNRGSMPPEMKKRPSKRGRRSPIAAITALAARLGAKRSLLRPNLK